MEQAGEPAVEGAAVTMPALGLGAFLAPAAAPVRVHAAAEARLGWQAMHHALHSTPPVATGLAALLWHHQELLTGNTGGWADAEGEPPDLADAGRPWPNAPETGLLLRQPRTASQCWAG